jgi:hypothetical protein
MALTIGALRPARAPAMIAPMESIIRAPIPSSSLITLADARLALAQATDVSAVATLVDRLEVVRVAARKARLSLEAQNDWATLKLEAERKAGGMLTDLRRAGELHAGRPNNADNASAFLSGFGISQQQSSRWQRLSTVPEDAFRAWLEQIIESGSEVTEVGLTGVAARMKVPEQPYVRPTAMPPGVAPRNVVIEGDCLQVLATLPDSCVDALVTDPPAAISFLNTGWDSDRGGRDAWVAWMADVLRESLRVVKPGGYALVWSLPRTSHWTGWALEEAGWEIRDSVIHVFFQGMPKSLDAGKALHRLAGAERPVVGKAALEPAGDQRAPRWPGTLGRSIRLRGSLHARRHVAGHRRRAGVGRLGKRAQARARNLVAGPQAQRPQCRREPADLGHRRPEHRRDTDQRGGSSGHPGEGHGWV